MLLIEELQKWHVTSVRKLLNIRGLSRRVHSLFVRFLFIGELQAGGDAGAWLSTRVYYHGGNGNVKGSARGGDR